MRHASRVFGLYLWLAVLAAEPVSAAGGPSAGALAGGVQSPEEDDFDLWYAIGVGGGFSSGDEYGLGGGISDFSGMSYADDQVLAGGAWVLATEDSTAGEVAMVGVDDALSVVQFALLPILPNPSRGVAYVGWDVPRASPVQIAVHDVQGRQVATLADGTYAPGRYQVRWSPLTAGGGRAAGIYFVRLRSADGVLVRRLVMTP
jgi:hypothetical protein